MAASCCWRPPPSPGASEHRCWCSSAAFVAGLSRGCRGTQWGQELQGRRTRLCAPRASRAQAPEYGVMGGHLHRCLETAQGAGK